MENHTADNSDDFHITMDAYDDDSCSGLLRPASCAALSCATALLYAAYIADTLGRKLLPAWRELLPHREVAAVSLGYWLTVALMEWLLSSLLRRCDLLHPLGRCNRYLFYLCLQLLLLRMEADYRELLRDGRRRNRVLVIDLTPLVPLVRVFVNVQLRVL